VETDIIFIHGLTGDSHDTWVSNTGVYWPTQLLAKDLPNCRIMTFGYDADVVKLLGPVSQNRVRDHAADLIGDLASIRGPDNTTSTPIIFVVHSLGGLVAKKALCLSEQAISAHEQQLHSCTVGLAFLGTPHRGSGLAPFAAGVAQILKAAQKRVNTEILSLLQRDSEVLADVDAAFGTWLRKRGSKVQLTCFSEAYELPGIGLVSLRDTKSGR
jgi:pimeloyl-ACP methyl ester carboxylesterase